MLVKLVDQENLMAEYEGHCHDFEEKRELPHISVGHVIFNGNHIMLPSGVALSC